MTATALSRKPNPTAQSKVIDATNGETAYSYDSRGNKLTQTDAEGRITRWEYDALGRVTARILPMGQRETFAYDAVGNVLVHVDFNGQVTTSEYDSLNRLTKKTYADGIVETWTYDAAGRTTQTSQTIDGNTEVTAYAYDDRDRLIEETKPDGSVLTYTYDLNGNKTAVTVIPAGGGPRTVSYTYDALNRLSTVTDEHGVTTYTYDPVGNRVAVTQANGVATSYRYDALNRLSQLTSRASDGTILQQYDYTLDATGRRTLIEEHNGRVSAYVYDDLYRLVEEAISDPVNGNHQSLYQYDGVGNRIQATVNGVVTTYDYDANDRLLSQGGTSYSYDDNGNTMAEINAAGSTSYVWDARNRLVEATTPAGILLYGYDINGIRTSRSEGGIITNFVVDHNQQYAQVLAETEGGATTKQYTYGDDLLSQTEGAGQERFFLYDGLGTTRALADGAEAVTDTYAYEAFGELLGSTGSSDNAYRYTGEQYDSGLDQYYLRARYYDQGVGRFTQMDTWAGKDFDPVTLHKYLYAGNDPVLMIDPSGYSFDLSSFSIANNISARLTTMAISFPRVTLALEVAAGAATPIELAALSPVSAGLIGGGTIGLAAVRHLENAQKLAESSFWLSRINSGVEFEKFVSKLISQTVNTRAIVEGALARGRPLGSAIPDFFFRSGILEAKLSGAAVTKNQLQQYAKYVGEGGNITYLFKQKPTAADIAQMERWIKETGSGALLQIAYIFE